VHFTDDQSPARHEIVARGEARLIGGDQSRHGSPSNSPHPSALTARCPDGARGPSSRLSAARLRRSSDAGRAATSEPSKAPRSRRDHHGRRGHLSTVNAKPVERRRRVAVGRHLRVQRVTEQQAHEPRADERGTRLGQQHAARPGRDRTRAARGGRGVMERLMAEDHVDR
jgi:hypothetical protein